MSFLYFTISAILIVAAGSRLTVYADQLADRLNLGKLWIGVVLLGLVTSLPEAITSLAAVVSLNAPDLAVGNILGSNVFNPTLVVVMDLFYRKGSVTNAIEFKQSYFLGALFIVGLTLIVIAQISTPASIMIGGVNLSSLLIIGLYFWSVRLLSGKDQIQAIKAPEAILPDQRLSLSKIWINLVVSGMVVVVAAMWLAESADQIAFQTGLGQTFVGSIFLAVATSLPEMVVSLWALKMGVLDLAFGNIFGSNMINIFILAICDMAYGAGPILNYVSATHAVTAVLSIVLILVLLLGIKIKKKKAFFQMGWDSIIIGVLFLLGTTLLYQWR